MFWGVRISNIDIIDTQYNPLMVQMLTTLVSCVLNFRRLYSSTQISCRRNHPTGNAYNSVDGEFRGS